MQNSTTTSNAIAGLMTLALAALPVFALATGAHAEPVAQRVQVADLDLNSAAGLATFQQRADGAVKNICRQYTGVSGIGADAACRIAVRTEIDDKLAVARHAQLASRTTVLASR